MLLLNSQWRSQFAVVAVDTSARSPGAPTRTPSPITPIAPSPHPGTSNSSTASDPTARPGASWSLLAAVAGRLVACCVAPDSPPALFTAQWPAADGSGPVQWQALELGAPCGGGGMRAELPPAARQVLDGLEYRVRGWEGGHEADG